MTDNKRYLKETYLLNYNTAAIVSLITEKGWLKLDKLNRLKAIYNYVMNDILFGYNKCDDLKASLVLKDGYGQCNTKSILFMALLRGSNIDCRIHGFRIDKKLQYGAMTSFVYKMAPEAILHTWVEVFIEDRWLNLEGFILDKIYLNELQAKFSNITGPFIGYGVAVDDFKHPPVEFNGDDTYIQSKGIIDDLGIYDDPDELFKIYKQNLSPLKEFAYEHIGRKIMNHNIRKIRGF